MKIAVCEDNSVDLNIITDYLDKYSQSSGNKFKFDTFRFQRVRCRKSDGLCRTGYFNIK